MSEENQLEGVDVAALDKAAIFGAQVDGEALAAESVEMQPAADVSGEWVGVAKMVKVIFCTPLPELAEEWTDERIEAFGLALGNVAQHYGWGAAQVVGHPLFGLAIASYPLGASAVKVIKERKAKNEAKRKRLSVEDEEGRPA